MSRSTAAVASPASMWRSSSSVCAEQNWRKFWPGRRRIAATDRREVTEAVAGEARRRGVWVNAADDPAFCDFLLPSVLRRGRLVVAVSTGGASPALAARVKQDLEAHVPSEYEALVELAAEVRSELRARATRPGGTAWREALGGDLVTLLAQGKRGEAKARLLDRLGVTR